ncbi:MAG: hypothetical protein WCH75_30785, partial [Candidatus Binatia bacterium]
MWTAPALQEEIDLIARTASRAAYDTPASTANSPPFDVSQPYDRRIHNHVAINANGIPKALA